MSEAPCPQCSGPLRITDSRIQHQPTTRVRRRRRCDACNLRFVTYEVLSVDPVDRVVLDITNILPTDRKMVCDLATRLMTPPEKIPRAPGGFDNAAEIERLDAISRTRALTEAESKALEAAMRRQKKMAA